MGWVSKVIGLGFAGYVAYGLYDTYRAGYFSLPELPDGAYTVSFANGMRGIVLDAQVGDNILKTGPAIFRRLSLANRDRKYLGIPMDVAPWFEEAWSTCISPTGLDAEQVTASLPEETRKQLRGARLEAICYIEVDSEQVIPRGLIYSVPNL